MKGGFFVAGDAGLYQRAEAVLLGLGAVKAQDSDGAVVQLADPEGRLLTLFERAPAGTEWEYDIALPGGPTVVACPFECRWVDLVVRIAGRVADRSALPTWVLDGDGALWEAGRIDPRAIVL
ncbi:hypothetical protein ABFU82_00730 [Nocardioides sp. WV_118_6]